MEHPRQNRVPPRRREWLAMFFPRPSPYVPGYELAWKCWPANPSQPSGDFLASYLTGNQLHFVIGDVSGKGPDAANISIMVLNMWRGFSAFQKGTLNPAEIATELNQCCTFFLGQEEETEDTFVTLLCGCLQVDTGLVRFASAGHPLPILVPQRGGMRVDGDPAPPLGALENSVYHTQELVLNQSDAMLLYTDGLTDIRQGENELGEQGLVEWLQADRHLTPPGLVAKIKKRCQAYRKNGWHDDICLWVAKRL